MKMCYHCGSNKKEARICVLLFYMMFCYAEMRLLRNDVCAARKMMCAGAHSIMPRRAHHFRRSRNIICRWQTIAHTMRTSFRRKADKRRYCIRITVPYDGVGDVAVGLDGGALFYGGDEQHL